MGSISKPLHSESYVNDGEKRLVEFLEKRLPDDYYIVPNVELVQKRSGVISQPYEYDVIVVAPHAIYHIENKDFSCAVMGNDDLWDVGGREMRNPLKTANYKSKVLHSILDDKDPQWGKVKVATLLTLSNTKASKAGIDPNSEFFKTTCLLNDGLIQLLTDPAFAQRSPRAIEGMQDEIVRFLAGFASRDSLRRKIVLGMPIDCVSEQCEEYCEYLCSTAGGQKYRVREYPLQRFGFSDDKLLAFRKKAENAENALLKIGLCKHVLRAEFSSDESYYYEKSQVLDDASLMATLRRRSLTDNERAHILRDVASALAAAHDAGVIHRDVSPANIYVTSDGSALLANFSCAWLSERLDGNRDCTVYSRIAGHAQSPYVAPEVADRDEKFASDIYSLGVVAYEMFVGKLPFPSTDSFVGDMGGVMPENLMPSAVVKEIPKWVDTLIRKSVVGDAARRWASAKEIIDFIDQNVSCGCRQPDPLFLYAGRANGEP